MTRVKWVTVIALLSGAGLLGAVAAAEPAQRPYAAATRVASLSPAQCRAELSRRRIDVKPTSRAYSGVATPLRLAGPLQGVRFRAPGTRSVYGVLDCRLALALDDFARVLSEAGVVEVRVDNFYRPHAHLPGRRNKPSQHAYGLAADINGFVLRDGRSLIVERDWGGALGEAPCDEAVKEGTSERAVLRTIVCNTLDRGLFRHVLTPNTDAAHQNHIHFDIARSRPPVVHRKRQKRRGR